MRKRLDILKEYLKWKKHISYVESRVVELRGRICKQAVMYGNVDKTTRELFLKYNRYLVKLRQ